MEREVADRVVFVGGEAGELLPSLDLTFPPTGKERM